MVQVIKTEGAARRGEFTCPHGTVQTPVFMNVGTQGAIKGAVSAFDLKKLGCQVELSNTYHLHLRPGDVVVRQMGGLHKFMRWDGPMLTDSGGFQVFSLAGLRKITEEGVTFASHIDGRRIFMGPEESMRIQSNPGSDIALAQKIAEDMGKELVIKDMDFNSLLIELDNGTVDFVIASMAPSEDRKKQVDFSEPYEYSKVGCLVRTEDVEKYPTVESLEGKAIAAQTGSNLEEIANEQMSGSTLVSLAKVPDMIMQLQTGKVEAVLMDADTALGYLAQSDELTMVDYGLHIDDDGLAVAVKKGNSELLEQINAVPGDFLIRFMTSHPKDATQKLFETMARCEKVAPVLHLPFQAGNDRVLRVMNRRHTRAEYLEKIRALKALIPDVVLTSDIIVGFPGETTEEFEDTLRVLEEVRFDALFTFIFSPRQGTPAAVMDDPMSREEKLANFNRLTALQDAISEEKHAAYVGKTVRCLLDGLSDDERYDLTARTPGNRLVRVVGDKAALGQFRDVKITGANKWSLFGELI